MAGKRSKAIIERNKRLIKKYERLRKSKLTHSAAVVALARDPEFDVRERQIRRILNNE